MDKTHRQEVGSLLAYLQWVYENEPATLTPALLAGELAKIITGMAVTEDAIAATVTEVVGLVGFDRNELGLELVKKDVVPGAVVTPPRPIRTALMAMSTGKFKRVDFDPQIFYCDKDNLTMPRE